MNFLNLVIFGKISVSVFRPKIVLYQITLFTFQHFKNQNFKQLCCVQKEPVLLSKEVTILSQLASICFDVCRTILLVQQQRKKRKRVQTLLQNQIQLGTKIGRVVANNCRVAHKLKKERQRGITKITPNLLHNNHLRIFWMTAF